MGHAYRAGKWASCAEDKLSRFRESGRELHDHDSCFAGLCPRTILGGDGTDGQGVEGRVERPNGGPQ